MPAALPNAPAHGAASVSVTDTGPARDVAPRVRFPAAPDVA